MQQRHDYDRVVRGGGAAVSSEKRWSYADFVRANPAGARAVQSLLQYAGFFAPARLADRDIAIESGYAMASLAALAHDRILMSGSLSPTNLNEQGYSSVGVDGMLGFAPESSVRLHAQKRRSTTSLAFADRMRVALSVLAHVQVVVEKIAGQHGGERRRRQAIAYIETLKAICRLLLLACTREMLIDGGKYVSGKIRTTALTRRNRIRSWQTQRGRTVGSSSNPSALGCGSSSAASAVDTPEFYTGKRSGVKLVVPPTARVIWARGGGAAVVNDMQNKFCDNGTCRCSERRRFEGSCTCGSVFVDGTVDVSSLGADAPDWPGRTTRVLEEEGVVGTAPAAASAVTPSGGNIGILGRPQGQHEQPLHTAHGNKRSGYGCKRFEASNSGEVRFPQAWLMAGEAVNILRPLVYSHGCAVSGDRSWRPWLTSLGMDAIAYGCTTRAGGGNIALLLSLRGSCPDIACGRQVPLLPYLDDEQAAELRRRKMLWLLYLLRSPAFELLAEPVAKGAAGVFEGVPVFGGLATYALTMLLYVQRHHFYTST